MTTLADQLMALIDKRLPKAFEEGEMLMAKLIDKQMKDNTRKGIAFGQDAYDNTYAKKTIKDRVKLGFQVGHVDLRRKKQRIDNTTISHNVRNGATIKFVEGGQIFLGHHIGKTKTSTKIRSIFPKTYDSVPRDIIEDTKIVIAEVLVGG